MKRRTEKCSLKRIRVHMSTRRRAVAIEKRSRASEIEWQVEVLAEKQRRVSSE
jgi:hypothetical protein